MNDATTNGAALLRGVKCAWCSVIILENSTAPGTALWSHGICFECRKWVEVEALTTSCRDGTSETLPRKRQLPLW